MSAARRRRHRAMVADQRRETYYRRKMLACRSTHWKMLQATITMEPWLRPIDMDARVSFLDARCRRCHTFISCPMLITATEEIRFEGTGQLREVLEGKVLFAKRTLLQHILPRHARLSMARQA